MYVIQAPKNDYFLKEYNRDELLSKDALKFSKNEMMVFGDYQDAQNFLRMIREESVLNHPTKRIEDERWKLSNRTRFLKVAYIREHKLE